MKLYTKKWSERLTQCPWRYHAARQVTVPISENVRKGIEAHELAARLVQAKQREDR